MNPYLPTYEYVPDGEPHVFGERLYVFGSHDRFGGTGFCENDYVCWSCPVDDLSAWRYEGVIYRREQDVKNAFFGSTMYAPDVCRGTDGRYYLYYGLNLIPLTGVAVCDTPAGQYEFYGYVRHKNGKLYGREKGDGFPFDPAVINDNGGIFLYTGFSPCNRWLRLGIDSISRSKGAKGCKVLELAPDMKTIVSSKWLIPGTDNSEGTGFEGHEFYEASSIRKFGDRYIFVYSSVLSHELCWAYGKYPDKDFSFGGVLYSNCDLGLDGNTVPRNYWGNNHGGVERINGEYYVFGHRHTNYRECNRQGIAEKLGTDADGNFLQAEVTSMGPAAVPLGKGRYEAGICCNLYSSRGVLKSTFFRNKKLMAEHPCIRQDGIDREDNPKMYIHNMTDGSVAGFKYFACEDFVFSLEAAGSGKIEVSFTDDFSETAGVISLSQPDKSCRLSPPDRVFALYLRYSGEGSADIYEISLE